MVKAIIDSRKINSLAQISPIPRSEGGGVVTHQNSSVGFRVISSAYDSRTSGIYLSQIGSEIINSYRRAWLNLSLLEVSGTTVVGENSDSGPKLGFGL